MHSLSYQQKNISFCFKVQKNPKTSVIGTFSSLLFAILASPPLTSIQSHMWMFKRKESLGFSWTYTFINCKEETYVHTQAWNTVNKHSAIMSRTGQTLGTQRGSRWPEKEKKKIKITQNGMTSWYKKKYSLSRKQVKHRHIIFSSQKAAVSTKAKKTLQFSGFFPYETWQQMYFWYCFLD